jgi:glyoxylase-like metal-dependent hydrolase (beta-lactamase superfamily II)
VSYHGRVHVGGAPAVRELTDAVITKVAVGPMDNNSYLVRCRDTGEQLLVDAAADPQTLLRLVNHELAMVVTTHQHADHWQALDAVVAGTDARTAAGRPDVPGIPVPTDVPLDDGDTLRVGCLALTVIALVGHTPGGIALLYDDPTGPPHLFTGDSLFPGGVGNTHGDPKAFASLIHDVRTKLFDQLPDETWVYPGHGNDTTLGDERPHLDEWLERGW